jgi:hypothetical protein
MGEVNSTPRAVPYQMPVNNSANVDDTKAKDVKAEPKPQADQPKEAPQASNPSGRKLEQGINGTARQAALNGQLDKKEQGESIKSAEKILDNPKLSNEAKIAQLQKVIEKTDKAEFKLFMAKYPSFSNTQKELINSAITESPKIMERVAGELSQAEQLTVVWNGMMHSSRGKSEKEETKRQERTDKAMGAWMQRTDVDTLNKALDGKSIDPRASAKLFAVIGSDPARLVINMGYNQAKLLGDNMSIANDLMNLSINQHDRALTRQELESAASGLMMQYYQNSMKRGSTRNGEL